MSEEYPRVVIERLVKEEWGAVLAVLVGQLRDIQLAEDALQDACVLALEQWRDKIPDYPRAWLLKVARRKMIDQVRRKINFRSKEADIVAFLDPEWKLPAGQDPADRMDNIPDERLRLILTCCHPALSEAARVALTLQTLGGLKTPEVARAFLTSETTMSQRLVRAKRKIKKARIPYDVPGKEALPGRVGSVLSVIYLIFNAGYTRAPGDHSEGDELCLEALRLARIVVTLLPDNPEAMGLCALLLLHLSRSAARTNDDGHLITLEEQDRGLWNQDYMREGLSLIDTACQQGKPGPFQLQAAISALHSEATCFDTTDWAQIYLLYKKLYEIEPSPVVELNGIVALSYHCGAEVALEAVNKIGHTDKMEGYLPYHAAVADLCQRTGNYSRSAIHYRRAVQLSVSGTQGQFFEKRLIEVLAQS